MRNFPIFQTSEARYRQVEEPLKGHMGPRWGARIWNPGIEWIPGLE